MCRKGSVWQFGLTSNLNIASLPLLKAYGFMNLFYNLCNYSSLFYCFKDYYFGFLCPLKVVQGFFQLRLFCTFCFLLNRISWLAQHRRDAVTLFSTWWKEAANQIWLKTLRFVSQYLVTMKQIHKWHQEKFQSNCVQVGSSLTHWYCNKFKIKTILLSTVILWRGIWNNYLE